MCNQAKFCWNRLNRDKRYGTFRCYSGENISNFGKITSNICPSDYSSERCRYRDPCNVLPGCKCNGLHRRIEHLMHAPNNKRPRSPDRLPRSRRGCRALSKWTGHSPLPLEHSLTCISSSAYQHFSPTNTLPNFPRNVENFELQLTNVHPDRAKVITGLENLITGLREGFRIGTKRPSFPYLHTSRFGVIPKKNSQMLGVLS